MCLGFLSLAEELALFGQITLCFLCPGKQLASCAIFIFGMTFSRSCRFCFAKIRIFSLRDCDPRDVTPFPYISGAASRDEERLSQPKADTTSFLFFRGVTGCPASLALELLLISRPPCLTRISRSSWKSQALTYKGAPVPGKHKSREEVETGISDTAKMRAVLERLRFEVVIFENRRKA